MSLSATELIRHHSIYEGRIRPAISAGCLKFTVIFAGTIVPATFFLQMLLLDEHLLRTQGLHAFNWLWPFVAMELTLFGHMLYHMFQEQAISSGSLQWIIYSWLISAKCCVLYFVIIPHFPAIKDSEEAADASSPESEARTIINRLWLTPLFYCILTVRTLRQLFRPQTLGGNLRRSSARKGQEQATLDVVLLQDMVWHVVIDMIDIMQVMFMSDPASGTRTTWNSGEGHLFNPMLLAEFPEEVRKVRIAAGVLVVLALFFHQQSFPSITYVKAKDGKTAATSGATATAGSVSVGARASVRSPVGPREATVSAPPQLQAEENPTSAAVSQEQPRYSVDVVKARKRSAIVSILFVDMPLFTVRSYMYALTLTNGKPATYIQISSGTCAGCGLSPITTVTMCEAAAAALGLSDTTAAMGSFTASGRPEGCYYRSSRSVLYLNMHLDSAGNGVQDDRQPLCHTEAVAGGCGEVKNVTSSGARDGDVAATKWSHLGKPQLDKWWVKNILCLLLQAMQLRFVQQADLERSQNLHWWNLRHGPRRGVSRRRLRTHQDPILRRAWQDVDSKSRADKLQAAMEDTGAFHLPPAPDGWTPQVGARVSAQRQDARLLTEASEILGSGSIPGMAQRARRRRPCCVCAMRHRVGDYRCRLCNCDCSLTVVLHIFMGLVLGFFIAKVDFDQAWSELVQLLGQTGHHQ